MSQPVKFLPKSMSQVPSSCFFTVWRDIAEDAVGLGILGGDDGRGRVVLHRAGPGAVIQCGRGPFGVFESAIVAFAAVLAAFQLAQGGDGTRVGLPGSVGRYGYGRFVADLELGMDQGTIRGGGGQEAAGTPREPQRDGILALFQIVADFMGDVEAALAIVGDSGTQHMVIDLDR